MLRTEIETIHQKEKERGEIHQRKGLLPIISRILSQCKSAFTSVDLQLIYPGGDLSHGLQESYSDVWSTLEELYPYNYVS